MILPFGKYKGQELEATPTNYLKWLEENVTLSVQLREAIQKEISSRDDEVTSRSVSTESPKVITLEELLYHEIIKWLNVENIADRLVLRLDTKVKLQESLVKMLKSEVPRLKKLVREQGK